MSFDDPDLYEDDEPACTCNRAIPRAEMVVYDIPRKMPDGSLAVEQLYFDRACPVHGYSTIPASDDAANA